MATATRDRSLDTTAELFRRHGYTGTGLKQIVAQANAPFGSIYHHFPGGKEQLGGEVIRRSGRMYFELFELIMDQADDFVSGIGDFFAGAAMTLEATDYADACPIATVALEVASTNEPLREATAEVFESSISAAPARGVVAGVEPVRALELAMVIIAVLEGAFVLCRAMRTTEPLAVAGQAARAAAANAPRWGGA